VDQSKKLALAVNFQSNSTASAEVYTSATPMLLWPGELAVGESAVYAFKTYNNFSEYLKRVREVVEELNFRWPESGGIVVCEE
jgi:hypothetical protein